MDFENRNFSSNFLEDLLQYPEKRFEVGNFEQVFFEKNQQSTNFRSKCFLFLVKQYLTHFIQKNKHKQNNPQFRAKMIQECENVCIHLKIKRFSWHAEVNLKVVFMYMCML